MSENTTVNIRWDIAEALKNAFPEVKNIRPPFANTVRLEFETAAAAKNALQVSQITLPLAVELPSVRCTPDVTAIPTPAAEQLITVVDPPTSTGGRIYKNSAISTKHVSSLRFAPVVGSIILSHINFQVLTIQVISISVVPRPDGSFSVFVNLLHPESGRRGVAILRGTKQEDGSYAYSRRCFDLLVDKDDYKKANDDEILIHYISIESVTFDPETGLWSEIKLALDEATAPLSLFRMGAIRRNNSRRGPVRRGPGARRGVPRKNRRAPAAAAGADGAAAPAADADAPRRRGRGPGPRRPKQPRAAAPAAAAPAVDAPAA